MIPPNLPPGCTDADIDSQADEFEFCDYCGQTTYNQQCPFCSAMEAMMDAEREDDL